MWSNPYYLVILQSFPSRSKNLVCTVNVFSWADGGSSKLNALSWIRWSPCFSCVIVRVFVTCPHIHNNSKSPRSLTSCTRIPGRHKHCTQVKSLLTKASYFTHKTINKYTGTLKRIHDHLKHISLKIRSTEIVEKVHNNNAGLSTSMHNNTTHLHIVGAKPQLQPHSKFVFVSR